MCRIWPMEEVMPYSSIPESVRGKPVRVFTDYTAHSDSISVAVAADSRGHDYSPVGACSWAEGWIWQEINVVWCTSACSILPTPHKLQGFREFQGITTVAFLFFIYRISGHDNYISNRTRPPCLDFPSIP
jgi:hypothetical protein